MKKILIIDSDVEFLNSLSSELKSAGYDVVVASYAAAGLKMTEGVSLIILSVELPDMNGFVVCSQLKRDAMTADVPVFITSSANSTVAFEQHLNLANHADGYFLKPVDVQAMLQEMDAIFADIRAMQAATAVAGDEMIDVSGQAEGDADEAGDSEVIKALSDDDMSLFGDIDSKDLMGDAEVDLFDDSPSTTPQSDVSASVSSMPPVVSTPPVASVASGVEKKLASGVIPAVGAGGSGRPLPIPPRPGSRSDAVLRPVGMPNAGLSPASKLSPSSLSSASASALGGAASAPVTPGLPPAKPAYTPSTTLTGMSPVTTPGTGSVTIGLTRSSLNPALQGARVQVGSSENKPLSGAFASLSQTAIPAADMSRMSDEITVLKNEVTALKSEITARDNRITMLQSQCDALTSRCQNAETITEALKTEAEQALSLQSESERNNLAQIEELKTALEAAQSEIDRLRGLASQMGAYVQQIVTASATVG